MSKGVYQLDPMDLIRAENGDKEATENILSYFCDCVGREIYPDRAVMNYLSKCFEMYLKDGSFEKAFSLVKAKGRPKDEFIERDFLLVLGVAYEKKNGANNLEAFAVVSERHIVDEATVKRAWEAKPIDEHDVVNRGLIDDEDINIYAKEYVLK